VTLEAAIACATSEAELFGIPMAVYRLPGWPAEQYGVRAAAKLPQTAEISLTVASERMADVEAVAAPAASAPEGGQGSLF
jgi:hypothetical protein